MLDVYGSDPHWSPDFEWACKTTKVLEELDFLWFEEPLSPEAFDDYARLTQTSAILPSPEAEDFISAERF